MTNLDRLRNMPVEELAPLLIEYNPDYDQYATHSGRIFYNCTDAIEDEIDWLNQEYIP